jgi:hypothetical protein
VTLTPNFTGTIILPYRVTDGIQFSDIVNVTLNVTSTATAEYGRGLLLVDPKDYTEFQTSDLSGVLLGAPGAAPSLPSKIDLSSNFPQPGNQFHQGSCTAWATAYALKTYQERIEEGWSLTSQSHLFSPAFIYNELRGYDGQCHLGSFIHEALQLIVQQGAASLTTMPYDPNDCTRRPSSSATQEASKYKAASFKKVDGSQGIKAALANRLPVVGGIITYDSFAALQNSGSNAVYNSAGNGTCRGQPSKYCGHAVTIVGYDDNNFGGAYKIINSWGTEWGDGGYFWLPYSFAASSPFGYKILSETYILNDADNTGTTPNPEPEPPTNDLPNLRVSDWSASYDEKPGGSGTLTYEVVNVGSGVASSGFNVSLMLSEDNVITSNDIYVVYEPSAYNLSSGEVLYRDNQGPLQFRFPTYIKPGSYYMAVWVDDTNVVRESNERDNAAFGPNRVTMEATEFPDLFIQSWYAEWDDYNGNGILQYTIANKGATASGGWWIGLMLAQADSFSSSSYLLYAEQITSQIGSSRTLTLNRNFNVFSEVYGRQVPSGVYYMYLWADYADNLKETNDNNNWSYGNAPVALGNYYTTRSVDRTAQSNNKTVSIYNGKPLPAEATIAKIYLSEDGGIKSILSANQIDLAADFYEKKMEATDKLVFPISDKIHADIQRSLK